MRYTYPNYYKEFSCIGKKCTDTCCIGWAVDVDDESASIYKNIPIPIGNKLREKLKGQNGGYYFELDKNKRCPFLNKDNLCELILTLGEGGLCVTCTEYPRFYADTPIYEQVDLTLSCPEVARIFFSKKEHIKYITEDIDDSTLDYIFGEDPFGTGAKRDDNKFYDDIKHSDMEKIDLDRLLFLLSVREKVFNIIKYNKGNIISLWENLISLILKSYNEKEEDYIFFLDILSSFEDEKILSNIREMEVVNPLWKKYIKSICKNREKVSLNIKNILYRNDAFIDRSMERFISYLIFRYLIDAFYHKDIKRTLSFIRRCLRIFLLLLGEYLLDDNSKAINNTIIEERARIFSRQIEHSDRNVEILLK